MRNIPDVRERSIYPCFCYARAHQGFFVLSTKGAWGIIDKNGFESVGTEKARKKPPRYWFSIIYAVFWHRRYKLEGKSDPTLLEDQRPHTQPKATLSPFAEWVLGIYKKRDQRLCWSLGAVGETRTRTGLLPLPPQSSVSTISPPPRLWIGIAKVR